VCVCVCVCVCPVNLPYPGTLQEAEVFVMDSTLCQAQLTQWSNQHQITNDKICAGDPKGKDTQPVQQQDDYYSLLHTDNVYLNICQDLLYL